MDPDRPSAPEGKENIGQLDNLLHMLELSDGTQGTTHFLEDGDGEPLVILEHSLSMVRIPKIMIPTWADRYGEGSDPEDEAISPEDRT
jgi:hypothetical protein